MKLRKLLVLLWLFVFYNGYSQGIVVDPTTYTVPQLVQDVLFGSNLPVACSGSISNVSWSTGSTVTPGGPNGIAYFTNTNPTFPIASGVILTTGNTSTIPGPNTALIGDGSDIEWVGDTQLFNYINGIGIDPTLNMYNDATIIEFDFVPFSSTMSFNFVFASEEYGQYQCEWSDAFAFFLSNSTQGTPAVNLALIPATTTPISVVTIRDDAYNSSCPSSNPAYFGVYNGGANAATSATNFDGQTVKMTATSPVTPNETYHIKMVIADRNDHILDSAVFLEGGSFNIGNTLDLTSVPTTANQTVCVNTAISTITYQFEGSVTGATVTGLPVGVSAVVSGNTVTISGTPSIVSAVPYPYTITTTGGICGSSSMSGTISVINGVSSVQLTSAASTASQTVCLNSAIVPITYSLQGGATNAVVTGLPVGVTATVANGVVTISGTPTVPTVTPYTYTITPSGTACSNLITTGTITVSSIVRPSGATAQAFCYAAFISDFVLTGSSILWYDAPTGGNLLPTTTPLVNGAMYYASQTVGGCESIARLPILVTITAPNAPILPLTQYFCDSAYVSDLFAPGSNVLWYDTPVGGTPLSSTVPLVAGGMYYATQTIDGCESLTRTTVLVTITTTDIPVGPTSQAFCAAGLIADLVTTGTAIQWYSSATGGTPLLAATSLQNGFTYYASQTVNGCVSTERLAVTVTINPQLIPTFNPVPPICMGSTVTPLPTISLNAISGTWTPALNNTTSTTYTFTPLVGQCATIATTTTMIMALPQVSTLPALHYCDPNNDGFGVFDLTQVIAGLSGGTAYPISFHETLTDAQINGTFIPTPAAYNNIDVNDQLIYIRVESVESPSCYTVVTLPLIVDPTPEAITPSDFHLCDYTGAAGQEPFDLTTKIPEILGSINPVGTQVTFYTDNTAAQNGTNVGQITNVTGYLNIATPQTIYVRVEFTATGCYDIVPLVLIVDPLPLATQPNYPQYSLCDYTGAIGHETFDLASQVSGILLGQTGMDVLFYPSLAAAQAGLVGTSINELYPSLQYVNVPAYVQTLGIRITNHITGCYSISTMDIRVNPLPSPIPPTSPYTICDDNQDGISLFDLTTLTIDILQGAPYTITYFETATDADANTNPITDPAHYYNIFAFNQILYVRAEDPITHCYTVMPITIAVDPSPTAPINVPDIELCDQDSNPYNATTLINLTQNTTIVLGQQPLAASNYTVEYYTSLALAQAGTAPIIPATAFNGANLQTIWVRVENNLTGCYNIGTFDLIIHIPLLLTTPPVLNMCDDDLIPNNQHTEFDLTVRDLDINQGTGYTVTYYTSSNVLITDPAHYVNGLPGAVEPITAVVTTPFGCTSSTILDIRVLPVPTPLDPSTATPELTLGVQCENATGSGVAQFDLTTNAAYIMNGDPSVTLHYFPTQADIDNNTNEILNPATAIVGDPSIAGTTVGLVQYVYIAVSSSVFSDYTGRKCYKEVKEGFVVNPLPTVAPIADYQICEQDPVSNNGIEVFDLTSQTAALLAGNATTPVSNYTIKFYEDAAATVVISNPTAYSNTSNPQPIYVVITNTTTGCKSTIGTFNIVVNPKPIIAALMPDMKECDTDGVNDGQMLFTQSGTSPLASLAGYTESVLGTTQTAPTYVVEFYDNQTSAEAGISTNALTDLENYQVHTGTYWVRVENLVTGCYQLDSFDVIIEKLAKPVITSNTGSNIACVTWPTTTVVNNLILDSGITAPNYTFNWYADGQLIAGENNSTINITNVATSATHVVYTVEAVSVNPPMLGCTSVITPASTFDVIKSGQAANLSYTVTNAFAENQVITITNDGYGIYQYSMDDGPRQMSPIFENVSIGSHTIYVWDTLSPDGYSCGVQIIEGVETIDYPPYFTPNNDGIHDYWNIHGLQGQPYAKIFIFDRYGKLLKQLSPTTPGWDGTYNGHLMPSDDYWFTVDYLEGKYDNQFKGHFAMKR